MNIEERIKELEKENEELKSKVDMFNRLYRNHEKYFTPEEICLEFLPEKIKMLQIIDYIPYWWAMIPEYIEQAKEIVKKYEDNFAINGIDCLIKFRDESYEIEMSTLNFEVTYIKVFDEENLDSLRHKVKVLEELKDEAWDIITSLQNDRNSVTEENLNSWLKNCNDYETFKDEPKHWLRAVDII